MACKLMKLFQGKVETLLIHFILWVEKKRQEYMVLKTDIKFEIFQLHYNTGISTHSLKRFSPHVKVHGTCVIIESVFWTFDIFVDKLSWCLNYVFCNRLCLKCIAAVLRKALKTVSLPLFLKIVKRMSPHVIHSHIDTDNNWSLFTQRIKPTTKMFIIWHSLL